MAQENELLLEVRRLRQLLALLAIRGAEEGEAIGLLTRAGYTYGEIGELLGITANAVRLRLRRKRASRGRGGDDEG